MKLNYECLRNTLLAVQDNSTMKVGLIQPLDYQQILAFPELASYEEDDIIYTLKQLHNAEYIEATSLVNGGRLSTFVVYDITPKGHAFLKDLANDTVWKTLKKKLIKTGEVSLPVILDWAFQIASTL